MDSRTITSIETEEDYQNALTCVDALMDAAPDSPEELELVRLATLVEQYEEIHYPIDPPSEEAMEEFRRDQEQMRNEQG